MTEVRTLRSGRGRRWDEESIRAALVELLAGRDVWPTCEEFADAGAKHLREVIGRGRGAAWWANEMGLPGGDRPRGGVRRWSEERIRATLTPFLAERTTWPSWPEFNATGLHAFREALRHNGGPERWAAEMGVTLQPPARPLRTPRPRPATPPAGMWPPWSDERIAAELAAFLGDRPDWPRHAEFVEGGHKRLYHAVLVHGGTQRWVKRMGVQWVKRHGGRKPLWTTERIQRELGEFLEGRTSWPTTSEFEAAGRRGLLNAVRRHGSVTRWAQQFAIQGRAPTRKSAGPDARPSQRVKRPRWDDVRIAAAIAPLVGELGRWPTKSEFYRAGLRPALSAVYDHGGSALWQQRFGVAPKPLTGPRPERRVWTVQRVSRELRAFCEGRAEWPTYTEFKTAGRGALYSALCRHGGLDYWRTRVRLG